MILATVLLVLALALLFFFLQICFIFNKVLQQLKLVLTATSISYLASTNVILRSLAHCLVQSKKANQIEPFTLVGPVQSGQVWSTLDRKRWNVTNDATCLWPGHGGQTSWTSALSVALSSVFSDQVSSVPGTLSDLFLGITLHTCLPSWLQVSVKRFKVFSCV